MNENFKNWESFEATGASVPFYKITLNGINYIGFDTTKCSPPEPMVNAMIALNFIKDNKTRAIMINHKFPSGLIPKIENQFSYEKEELLDGSVKIEFILKDESLSKSYNSNVSCGG